MTRPISLKRPLIVYPLLVNLTILLVSFIVLLAVAIRVDAGGPYADERIIPVIAQAIVRDEDGELVLKTNTPDFAALLAEAPDLWFIAEDDAGASLSFGQPPEPYATLRGSLARLSYGQLRDRAEPHDLAAVVRRSSGPAGELTIIGRGRLSELGGLVLLASNVVVAPIFLLLALSSLIVTPWIVNRALAGLARASREAGRIDTAHRGLRLDEQRIPVEIIPLVRAVNEALRRLDDGYERQRRFIAAAAHEMRTPVAILRARIEASDQAGVRDLSGDVHRLATLQNQLLDLQRLDGQRPTAQVDLARLVQDVAADLAPLLIEAGRTIEVRLDAVRSVEGDAEALERVVTNLVQNVIEHGGDHIVIRISGAAIEVEDDGVGIPSEARERVLEPFQRLHPRSSGSGLGLTLVRQVVEHHGGTVSIHSAAPGGTIVRVDLGRN